MKRSDFDKGSGNLTEELINQAIKSVETMSMEYREPTFIVSPQMYQYIKAYAEKHKVDMMQAYNMMMVAAITGKEFPDAD